MSQLISSSEFPDLPPNESSLGLPLLWYGAAQRNSGGYYVLNDSVGHWVFIQAENSEAAIAQLNFITEESGFDSCPCCCSRWDVEWDMLCFGGHPEPMIDGKIPVRIRRGYGEEIRLYSANGSVAYYRTS